MGPLPPPPLPPTPASCVHSDTVVTASAVQGAARGRPRQGRRGFSRFLQCTGGGAVRTMSPPPSPHSSISTQQGGRGSGQSIGLLSRLSSRLSLALSRRGDSTLSRAGASFSRQRQTLAGFGRAPHGSHHHGRLQAPQQQAPAGFGWAPQGAHHHSTQQAPQQQVPWSKGGAGGAVQRPASRHQGLQEARTSGACSRQRQRGQQHCWKRGKRGWACHVCGRRWPLGRHATGGPCTRVCGHRSPQPAPCSAVLLQPATIVMGSQVRRSGCGKQQQQWSIMTCSTTAALCCTESLHFHGFLSVLQPAMMQRMRPQLLQSITENI